MLHMSPIQGGKQTSVGTAQEMAWMLGLKASRQMLYVQRTKEIMLTEERGCVGTCLTR